MPSGKLEDGKAFGSGTPRGYGDFVKDAKALYGAASRLCALLEQVEAATRQVMERLRGLYGVPETESPLVEAVALAARLLEAGGAPCFGASRELARAWDDSEAWFRGATKQLKKTPARQQEEDTATFLEQRLDGVDRAAYTFLRWTERFALPAAGARDLGAALDVCALLSMECPTVRDGGAAAAASPEAALAQLIPAKYLRQFLASRLTEENAEFCIAASALDAAYKARTAGRLPVPALVPELAQRLYEQYGAETSERQINVSSHSFACFRAACAECDGSTRDVDIAAVRSLRAEVVALIASSDAFRSFKSSHLFTRLQHRLAPKPFSPPAELTAYLPLSTSAFCRAAPSSSPVKNTPDASAPVQQTSQPVQPVPEVQAPQHVDEQQQKQQEIEKEQQKTHVVVAEPTPEPAQTQTKEQKEQQEKEPEQKETEKTTKKQENPTLEEILDNKQLRSDFKKFLRERGTFRLLRFRKAAGNYASKASDEYATKSEVKDCAITVCHTFLSDHGDEPTIGVTPETIKYIAAIIATADLGAELPPSLFDQALGESLNFLRLTDYPVYIRSGRWKQSTSTQTPVVTAAVTPIIQASVATPKSQLTPPPPLSQKIPERFGPPTRTASSTNLRGPLSSGLLSPPQSPGSAKLPRRKPHTPETIKTPLMQSPSPLLPWRGNPQSPTRPATSPLAQSDGPVQKSPGKRILKAPATTPRNESEATKQLDTATSTLVASQKELADRLRNELLPMFEALVAPLKRADSLDAANSIKSKRDIITDISRLLAEVHCPRGARRPDFGAEAAALSDGDEELKRFKQEILATEWGVTTRTNTLAKRLTGMCSTQRVLSDELEKYWKVFDEILERCKAPATTATAATEQTPSSS